MARIIENKDYIRNYLYKNKQPENVQQVLEEIEMGLKEIYGDSVIKIIPLGSLNGNWAIRKSVGLDKDNNDIDWGIYINVDQQFLEENAFKDLDDFLEKVTDFVAYALSEQGLESCSTFNAYNCFVNKEDLVSLVAKSQQLTDLYTKVPEDAFLEMEKLAMIYQSDDKDFIEEYEHLLKIHYPSSYESIIKVVKDYIAESLKVKPHHFFRDRENFRAQDEHTRSKFSRLADRIQKLREAAGKSKE